MIAETAPATVLAESECWRLLGSVAVGRLVTNVDGEPEIFPVNFVVQHRTILFRTGAGTKLAGSAMNNRVLFEADDNNLIEGWSVIVRGSARTPQTDDDLQDAERAWLYPWTSSPKPHFVRIRPLRVTGRRFVFGPEAGNP
jgi:nitroimidazol reductase NimA-like FMN-containing flavoprotein (pyridoxamine 5'-phosphate oxidase superfamily)